MGETGQEAPQVWQAEAISGFARSELFDRTFQEGMDLVEETATYLDGVLEAGNVLTVEPGLYFQADDETIAPELRGIGVRIEDDVLVTDSGARLLSDGLPRHPDEVERWVLDLMSSSQEGAGSFAMRLP